MTKIYDFNKAKVIIATNITNLADAELGMSEDWGWTADSIFSGGKCILPDTDTGSIAGIGGSAWATPTIKLTFSNDDTEIYDCYQDTDSTVSAEDIAAMKQFAAATGGMDSVQ